MRSFLTVIFLFVLITLSKAQGSGFSQGTGFNLGINLCGGEMGENNIPGTLNNHYSYPTEEEVDYFYKKGFKLVTIPFRWERVQKDLGGDLDFQEIGEMKKVVTWCSNKGMQVIISMHNLGRYRKYGIDYLIGSFSVSRADYADVWNRLVNAFSGYQNIYGYEIMTEPHEMQGFDWFTTAQQAINSIREADKRNYIIIAGENYAASESWKEYSDNLKNLKDPSDKIIYNAHCFFDLDFTGKYLYSYEQSKVEDSTGIKRVMPFVNWLKDNNKKGIVGAFGAPDTDPRWLKLMENFLRYLNYNNVAANYWASGKRWSGNPLSVYPLAQTDRPQMGVLQQFITGVAYEEKPIVASSNTTTAGSTPANANSNSNTAESINSNSTQNNAPVIERTPIPTVPPPPPESFLFLPGTILLPQPNGGLYKPIMKQINSDSGLRVAKYKN